MSTAARSHRGLSLIEALVALAVMAFGMLGIVGVQSTLRMNSDVAKQRSEAVRLAQQAIEDSRSFTQVVLPATLGVPNYGTVTTQTQTIDSSHGYKTNYNSTLFDFTTNATYTLTSTVTDSSAVTNLGDDAMDDFTDPRMKTLQVSVGWTDRAGNTESVVLNTAIARIMPEIAGTLALVASVGADGTPTRGANGRNPNIPAPAVNFGDGTSGYIPPNRPNGDSTAFLFSNVTAMITLCTTAVANNSQLTSSNQLTCTSAKAWPLSGIVDFASNNTAAQAVTPSGTPQSVQVSLNQTFPTSGVGAPQCYTSAPVTSPTPQPYVSYICAVPVTSTSSPASVWSGYSYVSGANILNPGTPSPPAGSLLVCRYTAAPPVVTSLGDLVVPAISNVQHPRAYYQVGGGLSAQNLLIVPYVNGNATDCPSGSPLPSGFGTYPQPSTAP